LTGFAQFIEYSKDAETDENTLISVSEGQFHNGELSGYGRKITSDGECRVGYWKQG